VPNTTTIVRKSEAASAVQ